MIPRLAFLAVVVALGATALANAQRQAGARERDDFSHADHVQFGWWDAGTEEVWRDCRGCHVFEAPRPEPRDECTECHYDEGSFQLVLADGYPEQVRSFRSELDVGAFGHGDHEQLACRACHHPRSVDPGTRLGLSESDDLPVPVGVGSCTTCHREDGAATRYDELVALRGNRLMRGEVSEGWEARFFERLNDPATAGIEPARPFSHADHVEWLARAEPLAQLRAPGAQGGSTSQCGACHASTMSSAGAALFTATYDARVCATCHLNASGPLVVESREGATTKSATYLTFDHADHLGFTERGELATADGYGRIEVNGCLACHAHDDDAETYVLREGMDDYGGCRSCHEGPEWMAEAPARDDRPAWRHDWTGCEACHDFTRETEKRLRPAEVERVRPGSFDVVSQVHPGIMLGDREATCAGCHRGQVEELPSRLPASRFRHATHLPAAPASWTPETLVDVEQRCLTCHATRIVETGSSAEVGRLLDGASLDPSDERFGLTYDPAACAQCHGDVDLARAVASAEAGAGGEVRPSGRVSFPHDAHVGARWRDEPMKCVTCHDVSGPSPAFLDGDLGVLPAAQDCTMCHAHDEEARAFTGNAGAVEVASCASCHEGGLPSGPVESLPRLTVAGFAGHQLHRRDEACSSCHLLGGWDEAVAPASRLNARSRRGPDGLAAFHRDPHGPVKEGPPGTACNDCHWNGRTAAMPTADDPASNAVRAAQGNLRTTARGTPYPGG